MQYHKLCDSRQVFFVLQIFLTSSCWQMWQLDLNAMFTSCHKQQMLHPPLSLFFGNCFWWVWRIPGKTLLLTLYVYFSLAAVFSSMYILRNHDNMIVILIVRSYSKQTYHLRLNQWSIVILHGSFYDNRIRKHRISITSFWKCDKIYIHLW